MKIIKNRILLSVLIVIFVVVTPSFIFSLYQYSTITDEEKVIETSDIFFVLIGFVFVWGSNHFGTWANAIGKNLVKRTNK